MVYLLQIPIINESAKKVPKVMKASKELKDVDVNGSSKLGKGGMASKIAAAELCREHNVDVVIADGNDPYTILEYWKVRTWVPSL